MITWLLVGLAAWLALNVMVLALALGRDLGKPTPSDPL
jgi:hypothetical protein